MNEAHTRVHCDMNYFIANMNYKFKTTETSLFHFEIHQKNHRTEIVWY